MQVLILFFQVHMTSQTKWFPKFPGRSHTTHTDRQFLKYVYNTIIHRWHFMTLPFQIIWPWTNHILFVENL